jgi:pre-mRNA-processing factor SLU7
MKGKNFEKMNQRYGGGVHFEDENSDLMIPSSGYTEYDHRGRVLEVGTSVRNGVSRYPEDIYSNGHSSVWGSWWNKELGWGYKCCHSDEREGVCLGEKGKKRAIVKEYKIVKKKEALLKTLEINEAVSG